MPPRIPTEADFAPLAATLPHALHFPSPPESTTAFLILFHGLGDSERPFAAFARSISLPGVLAISVRGTAVVPSSLLGPVDGGGGGGGGHYHWGDDLRVDTATGDMDADPGFQTAMGRVMGELVRGVLVDRCGWDLSDVMLFGFGQGGSLALGLASSLRKTAAGAAFKGAVSIGGPLPPSTVPGRSSRQQSRTSALVCQLLDDDDVDYARREFCHLRAVRWKRSDVAMPRDRDEALPIMQFFADRLRAGW